MARADVEEAFERAFKMWSDVTPLTFREVFNTSADITISFISGDHGDYYEDCPFDGESGELAHAFYPNSGSEFAGEIHLDESEHWTKTKEGANLRLTAVHEIGHSLGVLHVENKQAVMYAFNNGLDPTAFELDQDDIDSIQALYGGPKDGHRWQRYQSSPGKLLAEQTTPKLCDRNRRISAVATYEGKIVFFFRDK
ncbi:UNVERIFIED_CONTAM: hypothetical protein K2H54_067335 [Gekko kuhli]